MADRNHDRLWRRALDGDRTEGCWRGVEDYLGADVEPEPPLPEDPLGLRRRTLLSLMAPGIALAGLGGCIEPPRERILPYVVGQPELTPGVPIHFATSMTLDGYAVGLVVESREGRPIKVEGNPEHPASLGATRAFEQASVLGLYDPDRARAVTRQGRPSSWATFQREVVARSRGEGLWFVMEPQTSPLVGMLLERIKERLPGARFVFYRSLDSGGRSRAAQAVFGRPVDPQYRFERADKILSLDADFTCTMAMSIRWAHDFAAKRRLDSAKGEMNRLYMVEPMPTATGTLADHRLAVRASDVARIAAGVLAEVMVTGGEGELSAAQREALVRSAPEGHGPWMRAVARDLMASRGASLVLAGDQQPAETHALAHLINAALGNLGRTVEMAPAAWIQPDGTASLEELVEAIDAGNVATLVILEANPVYSAPADLELARRIQRVPATAHLTLYQDETSRTCQWTLPALHYLESWGDARAYDGTLSFIQPLIQPLYPARTTAAVLAAFAGETERIEQDIRKLLERLHAPSPDQAQSFKQHLQRGFVPGSAHAVEVEADWDGAGELLAPWTERPREDGLELQLTISPKVHDGRFANNAWLQELPHPLTKVTWDNAAVIAPSLAAELGLHHGRIIELRVGERTLEAPVFVLPGHAEQAISLAVGYGRELEASVARGVGVNAYRLRTGKSLSAPVTVRPTAGTHNLAMTQNHDRLNGRDIALYQSLASSRAQGAAGESPRRSLPTMHPEVLEGEPQWAMSIDTMICTGCSACVIACQAENNIPVVGREGVLRAREMHWLRIDRYFTGPVAHPQIVNQPMLCQHCEKAPCEYVCPVNATVHSPDGLNEMVYNRCVGTRFCSNNCPYKVRRFNWFEYTNDTALTAMQRNPDVTVRDRGVMEKCTYCVQRIRTAEKTARKEHRSIRPGEVVTACQQACPTHAIAFGSLSHHTEPVVQWRRQGRAYAVLRELGTRPRTEYLAKISNPNSELV